MFLSASCLSIYTSRTGSEISQNEVTQRFRKAKDLLFCSACVILMAQMVTAMIRPLTFPLIFAASILGSIAYLCIVLLTILRQFQLERPPICKDIKVNEENALERGIIDGDRRSNIWHDYITSSSPFVIPQETQSKPLSLTLQPLQDFQKQSQSTNTRTCEELKDHDPRDNLLPWERVAHLMRTRKSANKSLKLIRPFSGISVYGSESSFVDSKVMHDVSPMLSSNKSILIGKLREGETQAAP